MHANRLVDRGALFLASTQTALERVIRTALSSFGGQNATTAYAPREL